MLRTREAKEHHVSLKSRMPVHELVVPVATLEISDAAEPEPTRELLGKCSNREVLQELVNGEDARHWITVL